MNSQNDNNHKMNDVFFDPKREVLSLGKHPFFKMELDPVRARRLLKRVEPFAVGAFILAIIIFIWTSPSKSLANEAVFYPSNCLGTALNPSLATGSFGEEEFIYAGNSAAFYAEYSDIFCGGFVGEIPETSLPKKFVLHLATTVSDIPILESAEVLPLSKDPVEVPLEVLEVTDEMLDIFEPIIEEIDVQEGNNTENETSGQEDSAVFMEEESIEEVPIEAPVEIEETPAENEEAPEATPQPDTLEQKESLSEEIVSWFFGKIRKIAFAQEIENVPEETSEEILVSEPENDIVIVPEPEPESEINVEATALEPEQDSTTESDNLTSEGEQEKNVFTEEDTTATSEIQDIADDLSDILLPEDILSVKKTKGMAELSYTLDGATWVSFAVVSKKDLEKGKFDMLISEDLLSWDLLSNMQVKIHFYSSDTISYVYLNGMSVSVEYEKIELEEIIAEDFFEELFIEKIVEKVPLFQYIGESYIYDESAIHSCGIEPFRSRLVIGEKAEYKILLTPSYPGSSYRIGFGNLPLGVHPSMTEVSGTGYENIPFYLTADDESPAGSYSIIVVYRERQIDGTELSNFCQFNLFVDKNNKKGKRKINDINMPINKLEYNNWDDE